MPTVTNLQYFKTAAEFRRWLTKNHADATEVWIGFYKKDSGKSGITYAEALDEALCFGWIDGIRKSVNSESYTNRFTPRTARSGWSQVNTGHVERLTKAGRMRAAGLKQAEIAKQDGRWDKAYASPAKMKVPEDFLKAVKKNSKAYAFFKTLNRANLFAIGYRLQTAKKPETRARRMEILLAKLARGESIV